MKNKTLAMLFAGVAVLSVAGAKLIGKIHTDKPVALIYENGRLIEQIDLTDVENDYKIELGGNTVLVEKGQISIIKANCPDKLCITQGVISNGSKSIICLPNKVEIKIKDGTKSEKTDAVTG